MSSGDQSQTKKRQGRRKVEMVKIEKESNLQVTFSKRRAGLFKKASELCTLTGAETGVVVFSPGNKAHSFGHPDISTITDNFLSPNSQPINEANEQIHVQRSWNPASQNLVHLDQVEELLKAENLRRKMLDQIRKDSEKEQWFPTASIDKLDSQQIDHLNQNVTRFRLDLEANMNSAANCMGIPHNLFRGASSSSRGVSRFVHGSYQDFGVAPGGTVGTYDQVGNTDAAQYDQGGREDGNDMPHPFSTNNGCGFF
ncbi:hypothetical protein BUALT_Bualt15G0098600 [Buddleja alternifolia]|uniref:MADS-box domain-containing protein n=1 Tax=Buddleja alternifolia TaxID=168488 RepID=A0AAV6WPM0_9LAMI|nr:hypothetical protein BUALT_Bualt15G0098600 [Buddleja alternifolia]